MFNTEQTEFFVQEDTVYTSAVGLRSWLRRSGGKNSAALRQPFWPKGVNYVSVKDLSGLYTRLNGGGCSHERTILRLLFSIIKEENREFDMLRTDASGLKPGLMLVCSRETAGFIQRKQGVTGKRVPHSIERIRRVSIAVSLLALVRALPLL